MRTLLILVPKVGSVPRRLIDKGSGLVSELPESGPHPNDIEVYFEGNRFNSPDMHTFQQKVHHAAGRLSQRYPTVARGVFKRADFDVIGTYHFSDDWQDRQMQITDPERLRQWEAGQ